MIMDSKEDDFMISSLRGLLIVLGLSVHELFEGLAIGLESSSSYVWYVSIARGILKCSTILCKYDISSTYSARLCRICYFIFLYIFTQPSPFYLLLNLCSFFRNCVRRATNNHVIHISRFTTRRFGIFAAGNSLVVR